MPARPEFRRFRKCLEVSGGWSNGMSGQWEEGCPRPPVLCAVHYFCDVEREREHGRDDAVLFVPGRRLAAGPDVCAQGDGVRVVFGEARRVFLAGVYGRECGSGSEFGARVQVQACVFFFSWCWCWWRCCSRSRAAAAPAGARRARVSSHVVVGGAHGGGAGRGRGGV